ncbi:MAG TPA: outer membrane lipoprotein carrier protein LolA [Candidatus Deferrimicrobiaceae bacterium]|jgi:outer membrane lipoprotein carrier protein
MKNGLMGMTRSVAAALAAFTLVAAGQAGAADKGSGDALFAKVSAKYGAVQTLSARFRQEVPLQNLGIVRKASGDLYFARPSRMRWNYTKPDNQLFLADGAFLYFRPSDSRQVFRKKIGEGALGGKIPLLLFFGKGNMASMFSVESAEPLRKGTATALRLIPKGDGAPEVKRIDLVVENEGLRIVEIHLYDNLGSANHLYLDGIAFNPSLPADLFRFKKPAGTEVVNE